MTTLQEAQGALDYATGTANDDTLALLPDVNSVIIPRATLRGVSYFAFLDERTPESSEEPGGLEFPRGYLSSEEVDEIVLAGRISRAQSRTLGEVYADNDDASVILTRVLLTPISAPEDFYNVRLRPNMRVKWLSVGEVRGRIRLGEITHAATLAAWALYFASHGS